MRPSFHAPGWTLRQGRVFSARRGALALLLALAALHPMVGRAGEPEATPQQAESGPVAGEARQMFPQGTEYRIGIEDVLFISVWRDQDLTREVPVRPDGKISMPLIQDVVAAGKTPEELAQDIRSRLKDYLSNPSVTVVVREINSLKIYVLGEVVRPGPIVIKSKIRVLEALSMAGGVTPFGGKKGLLVYRKGEHDEERVIKLSYQDLISGKKPNFNLVLEAGDTVIVR
jgi:polysaccharide export outer membrane protein